MRLHQRQPVSSLYRNKDVVKRRLVPLISIDSSRRAFAPEEGQPCMLHCALNTTADYVHLSTRLGLAKDRRMCKIGKISGNL